MTLQEGGTANDAGLGIALDLAGATYSTGYFGGANWDFNASAIFGTTVYNSSGLRDIYLMKTDAAGVIQWVLTGGGNANDQGNGITVDSTGATIVVGFFGDGTAIQEPGSGPQSTFDATIGSTTLNSNGGRDGFVMRVSPAGSIEWVLQVGGAGHDAASAVAVDPLGFIIVTGSNVFAVN